MGKKSKVQKVNVAAATATDTAKNPDPTPVVTPINSSNHHVYKSKSSVRRSGRLQSVIKPVQNQVVEQIDLVESEKEDNENHVEQLAIVSEPCNQDMGPGPTSNPKMRDERVDHLLKTVEEYKSKVAQGSVSSESSSVGLIYKSLYLDSQKKIAALTSENDELARKLELVLAKLEVYENINKSTQAVIISNLEKAIETLVRPTSYFGTGRVGDAEVAAKESAKKRRI